MSSESLGNGISSDFNFIHDRPIERAEDDLLWSKADPDNAESEKTGTDPAERRKVSSMRSHIEDIVKSLTRSLGGEPAQSMTFLIHGPWGAGKSSALLLIRDLARKEAEARGLSDALRFCFFRAPISESLHSEYKYDARATLGLQILKALAGDTVEQQQHYLKGLFGKQPPGSALGVADGTPDAFSLELMFQSLGEKFSHLAEVDVALDRLVARDRKIVVVLVEDLDRCAPDFVRRVLAAIQHCSTIRNLFFVLAVDGEILRRAMQGAHGADDVTTLALEKYIQHAVRIPEFIDPSLLRNYLEGLRQRHEASDGQKEALGLLVDNAPLLSAGFRRPTPRTVKRFLNDVVRDLMNRSGKTEERLRFVKIELLRQGWPEFFEQWVHPAEVANSPERDFFIGLETKCGEFLADSDEPRFRFELDRLKQRSGGKDCTQLPAALARFLGMKPSLFEMKKDVAVKPDVAAAEAESRAASSTGGATSASGPASPRAGEQAAPPPPSILGGQIRHERIQELLEQMRLLLFDVMAGENTRDLPAAQTAALRAKDLVTSNLDSLKTVSHRTASILGDIAAALDRAGDTMGGADLFELSLQFGGQPKVRANNALRYAASIVTHDLEGLYPRAEELIAELKSPELAGHNRDKVAMVEIGLRMQMGRSAGSQRGRGNAAMGITPDMLKSAFGDDPKNKFVAEMGAAMADEDYVQARQVARTYFKSAKTASDGYLALRMLADALCRSDEEKDELEAAELYLTIVEKLAGQSAEARADLPHVRHNLATLLYKHEYNDLAGKLFFEAYKEAGDKMEIRRVYSNYLARAGRPELAGMVTRGQDLKEEVLIPSDKTIEERRLLTGDVDRWWNEMPFASSPNSARSDLQ